MNAPLGPPPDRLGVARSLDLFSGFDEATKNRLLRATDEMHLADGETLLRTGEPCEALYLLTQGALELFEEAGSVRFRSLHPTDCLGENEVFYGGAWDRTAVARGDTSLLRFPAAELRLAMDREPSARRAFNEAAKARRQKDFLRSAVARLIDADDPDVLDDVVGCCRLKTLDTGEHLFLQGEAGTSMSLIIRGRMEVSSLDPEGRRIVHGVLKAGDSVGEMALLSGSTRSADVQAVSRCELAEIDQETFDRLTAKYPALLRYLSRVVVGRLERKIRQDERPLRARSLMVAGLQEEALRSALEQLVSTLDRWVRALFVVTPDRIQRELGVDVSRALSPEDADHHRLESWLDSIHAHSDTVVLVTGTRPSPWFARCLERSEQLVLIGQADADPAPTDIDRALERLKASGLPPICLLLVHAHDARAPSGTRRWLSERSVDRHLHVRLDHPEDFARAGRWVFGKSVGLVLSGGAALGGAHLGAIDALLEHGIPVDAIGGTSAGAGIGALVAQGLDMEAVYHCIYQTFVEKNPFHALTFPFYSLVSGRSMDRASQSMFGELHIEDLWIPFFCASANLTRGALHIHRHGLVWRAVRASTAIPGVAPPHIDEGELFVDGGVLDNLPVAPMLRISKGPIVAVDVTATSEPGLGLEGTDARRPGGIKAMWGKLAGGEDARGLPTIDRTILRTMMLGSFEARKKALELADLVLQPPVANFNLFRFDAIDALRETGYRHAQKVLCSNPPSWLDRNEYRVRRQSPNVAEPHDRHFGREIPSERSMPSRLRAAAERPRRTPSSELDMHTALSFQMLSRGLRNFQRTPPEAIRPAWVHPASVRMESVDGFGPSPLELLALDEDARLRPKWLRSLIGLTNRTAPFEDELRSWLSRDEARETLKEVFVDLLPSCPVEVGDPNHPASLEQFIFQGIGAHRIERCAGKNGEDAFVLSMEAHGQYPVRSGFASYGGDAHLTTEGCISHIHRMGRDISPEHREWAHVRFLFRSTALAFTTIMDHLVRAHYLVSNGLALAAYRHLSIDHPLRNFLKPFLFRTGAINHGALQSLIPRGALLHRLSALTYTGLQDALQRARAEVELLPFDEALRKSGMHPSDLPEPIKQKHVWGSDGIEFWDRLLTFVQNAFERSDALRSVLAPPRRAETEAFWAALSEGPRLPFTRLDEPNLVSVLATYLFEVTARHAHVGFVAPYILDPTFAAGRVRAGAISADRQNSFQLCTIAALTGLDIPRIGEDWTHLMPDSGAKQAAVHYLARLREWQEELDGRNARRAQAFSSFSPRLVPTSVSR